MDDQKVKLSDESVGTNLKNKPATASVKSKPKSSAKKSYALPASSDDDYSAEQRAMDEVAGKTH